MKLIPAIDLKNGKVVKPNGNERETYCEINPNLAPSSDPVKFIEYILTQYDFNTIYIADLDSIENFINNNKLIENILKKFKKIKFLVDNGAIKAENLNIIKLKNFVQIIATETFEDYSFLKNNDFKNYILSLDFKFKKIICKNEGYKKISPNKVICMNMDSISKQIGINNINIIETKKIYPNSEIIISGGIKNNKDIYELKKNKFKEVILMTAILQKNIEYKKL